MRLISRVVSRDVAKSLLLMGMRASTLGIKLLLTLYIAKFLGLDELGIFGLLAAAQILLPSASSLGINHSLSRHVVTKSADEVAAQTRGYLLVVLAFYVLATSIGYAYFSDRVGNHTFWVAAALLLLENINSDAYHLLANQSKQVFANVLHFVRSALWAVAYMTMGWFDDAFRTFEWLLTFWLVGSLVAFLLLAQNLRTLPLFSSTIPVAKALSKLRHQVLDSWFLYTNGIVTSLGSQADRYIVTAVLGLEMTGVYVFYLQVSTALSNLHYTGLIQVQRPKVVLAAASSDDQFQRKIFSVITAALITTALSAFAAYFAVSAIVPMLDKPLLSEWHILLYFSLAAVVTNVVSEAQRLYFYALHEDRAAFYLTLASSAVAILVLYALLREYALTGAGVALIIAGIARVAMQHSAASSIEKHRRSVSQ